MYRIKTILSAIHILHTHALEQMIHIIQGFADAVYLERNISIVRKSNSLLRSLTIWNKKGVD